MRVILVEPNTLPRIAEVENTPKSLQNTVGGYIEVISMDHLDPNIILICNEEGKLMGLPLNRTLHDRYGNTLDYIAGTFIICAERNGEFFSIPKKLENKYLEHFASDEVLWDERQHKHIDWER